MTFYLILQDLLLEIGAMERERNNRSSDLMGTLNVKRECMIIFG